MVRARGPASTAVAGSPLPSFYARGPGGLRGLAGVWARLAAAGQALCALRAPSFAGVSLVEVTALAPAMCAGRRGGGEKQGGQGSLGGGLGPGVREGVWGWGGGPARDYVAGLPIPWGWGGHLDASRPEAVAGLGRPPPPPRTLATEQPAPLLGRSLPDPTFLGAHSPPHLHPPLAHQYPLPRTGTRIGNDLYFPLTSN